MIDSKSVLVIVSIFSTLIFNADRALSQVTTVRIYTSDGSFVPNPGGDKSM